MPVSRLLHNGRFSLLPAVHQSHHNAELCVHRQVFEIGAVLPVLGSIAVACGIADARFHAVDLVRAASVAQQVLSSGVARTDCFCGNAAAFVIDNDRVGRRTVVILPVSSD